MFEEYKYKTELHAHTSPVSLCSEIPPDKLVSVYAQNGYDAVVLTNHFYNTTLVDEYIEGYHKCRSLGEKAGINVILGAEIRFSECMNDYLIYGIEENELYDIRKLLDFGIDNFYKKFKNYKNIIYQAHPFRDGCSLASPDSMDGIEVFNLHPGHNSRIAYAAQYARKYNMKIIGGSDYHHPNMHCLCSICTKEHISNSLHLAQILKDGDYIIDVSGYKILPY